MRLFASTSKKHYVHYHDELIQREALKLLQHTVKGEEKQAKTMLESSPSLLLINNVKTVDYSGKSITGLTPFQAALCAGDTDMVKMMQPYFDKLEDGSQKMADQIHAVFPEDYDARLHAQTEATFNFDTILNAIAHASETDLRTALALLPESGVSLEQSDEARSKADSDLTLVEALNRFRETFSQHSLSETIYNPQHLLKAYALYNATFETDRGDGNRLKLDLFWRQIIGFCQRFVPAWSAQVFAQGPYFLVKIDDCLGRQSASMHAVHFNRSLKFRYGRVSTMYPTMSHCSGLGFDHAVTVMGSADEEELPLHTRCLGLRFFKKIISIKSTNLYWAISRSITRTRDARP